MLGGGKGSKKSTKAHFWGYLGEQAGDVVFDFTPGRGGESPKRMLAGHEGYLQADACPVYGALFRTRKIIETGCMVHATRKFRDAICEAPGTAELFCDDIRRLYDV